MKGWLNVAEYGKRLNCPHCGRAVFIDFKVTGIALESGGINVNHEFCPSCSKIIVNIEFGKRFEYNKIPCRATSIYKEEILYPKFLSGKILDKSIPQKYQELYRQAERVNSISPMASATLSRYILQILLNEELKIKKRNLEEEIKELEEKNNIPSKLVTLLQVMRKVANFGAHPKKSTNSNEIVEVENGEAEIMLDLIFELFDHVFVKPNQQQQFLGDIKDKYGIEV